MDSKGEARGVLRKLLDACTEEEVGILMQLAADLGAAKDYYEHADVTVLIRNGVVTGYDKLTRTRAIPEKKKYKG